MNHPGRRLSALVDSELTHDARERVHVHLARCASCRAEATTLRELKRRIGRLDDVPATGTFLDRLIAIGEARALPADSVARLFPPALARSLPVASWHAGARRWRRAGCVVAGAVSCALVGVGATAVSVGGNRSVPAPSITPPVAMYSMEHAITTGGIPFAVTPAVMAPRPRGTSPGP